MSDEINKPIYPSAPLEQSVSATQQQPLIGPKVATRPPQPPSYEQAISETTPAVTTGPNVVVVTGKHFKFYTLK